MVLQMCIEKSCLPNPPPWEVVNMTFPCRYGHLFQFQKKKKIILKSDRSSTQTPWGWQFLDMIFRADLHIMQFLGISILELDPYPKPHGMGMERWLLCRSAHFMQFLRYKLCNSLLTFFKAQQLWILLQLH